MILTVIFGIRFLYYIFWGASPFIDLFSRRVVGWCVSTSVVTALSRAVWQRRPQPGLMIHSDRGIQYCCDGFRKAVDAHQFVQSMSKKADCWDNAVSESFFKTLKTEWLYHVDLTDLIGILLLLFSWTIPLTYVYLYVLASFPEMLRIIFVAVRRKIEGAYIIGVGCVAFTLGCTYQILMELHILDQENFFPYLYGILCLVVSMSVYLARNFARTSKDLNAQLIQVKELSANLEHANRQLEDYSQTLEQKVEERTRELNGKNIKLEETLYQLGESEERFRSVTQSANDAIVVADSSGNVISWNKGAQTTFGYREEEVLGQELALLMPERYREAHRKGLERLRTTGEARVIGKTVELDGMRKDGSEFPLELSLDTWTTEKGTFFSGIIRDITERKQAEEELRKTQNQLVIPGKMASLGSLVAGVAHEMNTPLGAINSMHDTLIRAVDKLKETLRTTFPREYRDNRQVQSALSVVADANRVIATGTERVTGIVRSLRNFARLDEAEFQVADLHEGIKHTLTLMQTQMGDHITVVEDYADLKPVYCSPGELNQVFMHLLKNATQAIKGKGTNPDRDVCRSGLCVREDFRHGKGDPSRAHGQDLRSWLHHQRRRRGHGSGIIHQLQYRTEAQRGDRGKKRDGKGIDIYGAHSGSKQEKYPLNLTQIRTEKR